MCGILLGPLVHPQDPARLVQLCTNRALLLALAIMVMRSHLWLSFVAFLALIRPAWPGVQIPGLGFRVQGPKTHSGLGSLLVS